MSAGYELICDAAQRAPLFKPCVEPCAWCAGRLRACHDHRACGGVCERRDGGCPACLEAGDRAMREAIR